MWPRYVPASKSSAEAARRRVRCGLDAGKADERGTMGAKPRGATGAGMAPPRGGGSQQSA